MKHRKLRIAWSVAWGVVAVLLIALWIHGHWYQDSSTVWVSKSTMVYSESYNGWIEFGYSQFDTRLEDMSRHPNTGINFHYVDHSSPDVSPGGRWSHYLIREPSAFAFGVVAPFWLPILVSITISGLSWLPFRFSLRTLLIATTFAAVGLGLIVWLRH